VHPGPRVAEDEHRGRVFDLDDTHQTAILVHPWHDIVDMFHIGHVDVIAAQTEELGLMEEFAGKTHYMSWECG
jgi:hypothetical protein